LGYDRRLDHVDFPLLQRLALPVTIGAVRYPEIKINQLFWLGQAAELAVDHHAAKQ
jgi:hypothetical protein